MKRGQPMKGDDLVFGGHVAFDVVDVIGNGAEALFDLSSDGRECNCASRDGAGHRALLHFKREFTPSSTLYERN